MFFHIKVSVKDKQTLNSFIRFIKELKITSGFFNSFPKRSKRKIITVLKSPHVNKTAQEQFEFRFYTKEFTVFSFKPLTFLLTLKKMNHLSFFGVNLQIKGVFLKTKKKKLISVSPDNVRLGSAKKYHRRSEEQSFIRSERYVRLFDHYGEIVLRENVKLHL